LHTLSVDFLTAKKTGRFLLINDKIIHILPNFKQFLEVLTHIFKKRKKNYASLKDFVSHHFGKTTAERQIQAIVNGIFACDVDELHETALKSLYFTEKRAIYFILRKFFAKLRAKWQKNQIIRPIIRPISGFQSLIDALFENLRENIVLNHKITKIDENCMNFITIPAYCVPQVEGIPQNIYKICDKIRYQTISVATIFTSKPIKFEGIGCLSNAKSGILGVLFNSSAFAEKCDKMHSYSIFYKNSSKKVVDLWFESFFDIKIFQSHHFEYKNAIPIHDSSVHQLILENAENAYGTKIFSNYSGQISVSDVFSNAKKEIEKFKY